MSSKNKRNQAPVVSTVISTICACGQKMIFTQGKEVKSRCTKCEKIAKDAAERRAAEAARAEAKAKANAAAAARRAQAEDSAAAMRAMMEAARAEAFAMRRTGPVPVLTVTPRPAPKPAPVPVAKPASAPTAKPSTPKTGTWATSELSKPLSALAAKLGEKAAAAKMRRAEQLAVELGADLSNPADAATIWELAAA